jgi:hypothetical protein
LRFLVEFEINDPEETPESNVAAREGGEADATARLVDERHLVRVCKRPLAGNPNDPAAACR